MPGLRPRSVTEHFPHAVGANASYLSRSHRVVNEPLRFPISGTRFTTLSMHFTLYLQNAWLTCCDVVNGVGTSSQTRGNVADTPIMASAAGTSHCGGGNMQNQYTPVNVTDASQGYASGNFSGRPPLARSRQRLFFETIC